MIIGIFPLYEFHYCLLKSNDLFMKCNWINLKARMHHHRSKLSNLIWWNGIEHLIRSHFTIAKARILKFYFSNQISISLESLEGWLRIDIGYLLTYHHNCATMARAANLFYKFSSGVEQLLGACKHFGVAPWYWEIPFFMYF